MRTGYEQSSADYSHFLAMFGHKRKGASRSAGGIFLIPDGKKSLTGTAQFTAKAPYTFEVGEYRLRLPQEFTSPYEFSNGRIEFMFDGAVRLIGIMHDQAVKIFVIAKDVLELRTKDVSVVLPIIPEKT